MVIGQHRYSVTERYRKFHAFLFEGIPDEFKFVEIRQGHWSVIDFALHFAWRIIDITLQQVSDGGIEGHQGPGAFGEVVHEDVIAFLRVL